MSLPDAIFAPISPEQPAGAYLRYQPIYDKIKEARRQDDDMNTGVWKAERKVADYILVKNLCQDALCQQSKDLQIAVWLAEALLQREGFAGLRNGLRLCAGLLEQFWDTLYPELEDGDAELRAAPLIFLGNNLVLAVKSVPLTNERHHFLQYKESQTVGYEDQVKGEAMKKAREAMLKEGKLAPEVFDRAFGQTPKLFYTNAEADLDGCLALIGTLESLGNEKFGDAAPSYSRLKDAVTEVRHAVHHLLQKKRETEPDPVEAAPLAEPVAAETTAEEAPVYQNGVPAPPVNRPAGSFTFTLPTSQEPADRQQAIGSVVAAAAFLRQRDPYSPAAYLMLRGLRWGELRAAAVRGDQAMLEAPPTELRHHIKSLALAGKWKELLEAAEQAMALPCSRAWLDLQRLVVEAGVALGADYEPIVLAVRSAVHSLLRDVPRLQHATLMDDTPAANAETQRWLQELLAEPQQGQPALADAIPAEGPGWQRKFIDAFDLAKEAQRAGQNEKAFSIMKNELERQRSGRGRFVRRLQFVQLCLSGGQDAIAQPLLEDLLTAVENHKLEEWEDREMLAQALATITRASKKIQGDPKEKQKMFERICRLDPVQALGL